MHYQIALTLIPGIGDVLAKNLLAYCGSAEAVFKEKKSSLLKIPGIGDKVARGIVNHNTFSRAEEELRFAIDNDVQLLFITDDKYPERLKQCIDSPILLYYRGTVDLNVTRFISIVGTRQVTDYGRTFIEKFIADLVPYNVCVVSGLAYGVDILSHKHALKYNIPTIGVMAHGHDRLYPGLHTNVSKEMLLNGGLLSEFPSGTNPDRENFPKRNRIVAGISEATIVVEASKKGGALITAELANSYNRDVFAVPGRIGDVFSEGCNQLIKSNKAALIQGVNDLEYILGWTSEKQEKKVVQSQLFVDLDQNEKRLVDCLKNGEKKTSDKLSIELNWPTSRVVAQLTTLELKGVVLSMPGKVFKLV